MADNYLITGYCGKNHVTAENDRGINAGIFGAGRYVLPVGKQFKAEYIGANTVRIYDGKLVDNGAAAGIPAGEYIDIVVPNASQGMNRNDLIVFQYSQDSSTLIESGTFVVIRGVETGGTAVDPELQQEDLLSGRATFDQMALWRIPVSTGTISAPVQLFTVAKSLDKAGSGSVVVDAFSSDGASYTATVEDLEKLYNGLEITIIPNMTSTTTVPTLNVNGLGAKPIRLSLSQNNSLTAQPVNVNYYAEKRPIKLMFDPNWLSTGMWRVTNKQRPSAVDLYGTVPVTSGGTGLDEITAGSFLVGNGEEPMEKKTPSEVLDIIGGVGLDLLWENASPSSTFLGQAVSTPNSHNYDLLLIVSNQVSAIFATGYGDQSLTSGGVYGTDNDHFYTRKVDLQNNGTVKFENGFAIYTTSVSQADDAVVPLKIYGIKGA